jgi:hypothetical protein
MEAIIATRIACIVEQKMLLPENHLGGRKGTSCELALHGLTTQIHKAWREGDRVAILSLDVSGAYDNVSHERLLHDLQKRGLGGKWAAWIKSFLSDRSTTLKLPEYSTEKLEVNIGIPQGSPISPILYLFYNSDLLDISDISFLKRFLYAIRWIDDVNFLVTAKTADQLINKLNFAYLEYQK